MAGDRLELLQETLDMLILKSLDVAPMDSSAESWAAMGSSHTSYDR